MIREEHPDRNTRRMKQRELLALSLGKAICLWILDFNPLHPHPSMRDEEVRQTVLNRVADDHLREPIKAL